MSELDDSCLTPGMVTAGAFVIIEKASVLDSWTLAAEVYRAMWSARGQIGNASETRLDHQSCGSEDGA